MIQVGAIDYAAEAEQEFLRMGGVLCAGDLYRHAVEMASFHFAWPGGRDRLAWCGSNRGVFQCTRGSFLWSRWLETAGWNMDSIPGFIIRPGAIMPGAVTFYQGAAEAFLSVASTRWPALAAAMLCGEVGVNMGGNINVISAPIGSWDRRLSSIPSSGPRSMLGDDWTPGYNNFQGQVLFMQLPITGPILRILRSAARQTQGAA